MNQANIIPHQFQKGQSGNPNGRPKGSRGASSIIKEILNTEIDWKDVAGKPARFSCIDAMAVEQIRKALDGDTSAFNAVLDRAYGKPRQTIEQVETTESNKLIVEYVRAKSDDELKKVVEQLKERLSNYENVDDISTIKPMKQNDPVEEEEPVQVFV